MRRSLIVLMSLLLLFPAAVQGKKRPDSSHQWPQWRGPGANGVAPHANPPLFWSEEKNVRWKSSIPGKGLSTPVVWGESVFITSAVSRETAGNEEAAHADGAHDNMSPSHVMEFVVMAYDRTDGSLRWKRTVRTAQPHESTHVTGSWASGSALTDGQRLIVFFGSQGLYGLDLSGKVVWEKDLGQMQTRHGHGEGSSPALHGNTLIVNWDHQGDSFVIALDKRNGKLKWKVSRDEMTSWSTPLIVEHAGRRQVIISATNRIRAYDLDNGKPIWECGGLSRNVVASPVAENGIVYVGASYDWQAMMAIRLDAAEGDITGTDAVLWSLDRHAPYVPSPLLYDGTLCFLKHNQAFLSCLEAESGKPLFGPTRLAGIRNVFASPVGAANRIYVTDRNGTTVVLRRSRTPEVLARNHLDDSFSASAAVAGDAIYLRGERHLYCLAEEAEE